MWLETQHKTILFLSPGVFRTLAKFVTILDVIETERQRRFLTVTVYVNILVNV